MERIATAIQENTFTLPLLISSAASIVVFAALLSVFGVHLLPIVLFLAAATLSWWLLQHPLGSLGLILAFMPLFQMAFMLAEFFGPPFVTSLSPVDRIAVVLV